MTKKRVKFVDGRLLSRNSTSKLWKWNELQVEGCRLLSCPTELLLLIFGFVILDSLIHVVVAELEHAINKSSQSVPSR